MSFLNRKVIQVQAMWRGFMARKRLNKRFEGDILQVGKSFSRVSAKGVQFKDELDDKQATHGKKPGQMTADERKNETEKKKKLAI